MREMDGGDDISPNNKHVHVYAMPTFGVKAKSKKQRSSLDRRLMSLILPPSELTAITDLLTSFVIVVFATVSPQRALRRPKRGG